MRVHLSHFLLALPWLFVAPCAATAPLDPRPATDETLQAKLEQLRERHGLEAIEVGVFDAADGRLLGSGTTSEPLLPGEAASLLAGLALVALDADGTLSLDAEVLALAPELDIRNRWSERPVRIADVLSHRAGFGPLRYRDLFAGEAPPALLAGVNAAWRSLETITPPGERQHFSLLSIALAAYLVEKAAGMPYKDVIDRLVFRPLGIELRSPAAAFPATAFDEAIALPLTAGQLLRIGRLLANRGEYDGHLVVPAEALERLEASALVPGTALGVYAEEYAGSRLLSVTGGTAKSLLRLAWQPEWRQGYLITLRGPRSEAALRELDTLLRGQLVPGRVAPLPRPTSLELEPGWYRNAAHLPPPERLYRLWLEFGRLRSCGEEWCFRAVSTPAVRLSGAGENLLRERGRWHAGWQWQDASLVHGEDRWVRVSGPEVLSRVLTVLLAAAGIVMALVLAPLSLWRIRGAGLREVLPRLLPLTALLAALLLQLLLFNADIAALAAPGAVSIGIFVLSLLVPAGAVLGAGLAGGAFFGWLPRRQAWLCAGLSMAALANAALLGGAGLIAFRSWLY